LAGFSGFASIAILTGIAVSVFAIARKDTRLAGLGFLVVAGVVIALLSAVPARRLTREERALANRHADATFLGRARLRASNSIDQVFRRDAPMAKALLIADQHEISPEMRDRYARAGIIHMLSISGLHVAIIAGAMLLLLRLARLPPSAASLG